MCTLVCNVIFTIFLLIGMLFKLQRDPQYKWELFFCINSVLLYLKILTASSFQFFFKFVLWLKLFLLVQKWVVEKWDGGEKRCWRNEVMVFPSPLSCGCHRYSEYCYPAWLPLFRRRYLSVHSLYFAQYLHWEESVYLHPCIFYLTSLVLVIKIHLAIW